MRVTIVKFVYGDGVKSGEYEPAKRAEVHITAEVEPSDDYEEVLDTIAHRAVQRVQRNLNLKQEKSWPAEQAAKAVHPPVVDNGTISSTKLTPQPLTAETIDNLASVEDEFDSFDDIIVEPLSPTITTEQLTDEVMATNGRTKNPKAIRELIERYAPQDGKKHQLADIGTDKRQYFLDELKKVPKS